MEQKWYQSWVFWSTVLTGLVGILSAMGVWGWIGITEAEWVKITGAIISALAAIFGAWNNPYNKTEYGANSFPSSEEEQIEE